MMGEGQSQPTFYYYNMSLEQFSCRRTTRCGRFAPLIYKQALRRECRSLYSVLLNGRPSISPSRAIVSRSGRWLLAGIGSDRKLAMELQCNMALRWFVGLGLDEQVWDASTFSQNRRRRFDRSGILEKLFDQTVKRAQKENLDQFSCQRRWDSGASRTPASKALCQSKSPWTPRSTSGGFAAAMRRTRRRGPPDPGNPTVDFRGEKRGNKTHRSFTDPGLSFSSPRAPRGVGPILATL